MSDTPENEATASASRHWNYRVMEFTEGEDTWRAIHEVHYTGEKPTSYSATEAAVMWDVEGGEGAGLGVLERMREALSKPVLRPQDFVVKPEGATL